MLPEPFANTSRFRLEELSRYDDRGPGWYWNDIHTGEHTGTHLDAPVHWITGRDKGDVAQIAPGRLIAPAAVLDKAGADPDYLLQIDDVKDVGGRARPAAGRRLAALPHRLGRPGRRPGRASSTPTRPARTRRASRSSARAGWPRRRSIVGLGVETVGTDAGAAHSFDPPFPCHSFLLGAGKYGLTQLRNLQLLPPTGALLVTAPLPIVGGSGSPTRVLALVER